MKKLLMLPALGAAAALTYGAAAALSVTDSASIQVGTAPSLACADSASVENWGYESDDDSIRYVDVRVEDANQDCDGATLFATALAGGVVEGTGEVTLAGEVDGSTEYRIAFSSPFPSATLTDGLRLAIEG
jgi:hypothetical protein